MTDAGSSAKVLRMAVIGCGPIGRLHARAIAGSARAHLVAVCDTRADRAESTAREGRATAHEDVRELLAREALDAVTIATPDHLHVDVALEAIAAGCHVFCEKPLAGTLADAQRMVEAAQGRGIHLAVNYNRRFGFAYRRAKALVDGGRIGAIAHAVLHVSDRTPPPDVARNPQVMLTTLLTHHFDLMRHLCGEIVSVHASFGKSRDRELVRDMAVSLRFAHGAVGAIVAGYRDGLARTSEGMELGGTAGALAIEDVTRRVLLTTTDPDQIESFRPDPFVEGDAFHDTLGAHVRAFVERVADGLEPPVTGFDGLRGMSVAAAALESHQQGHPIEV